MVGESPLTLKLVVDFLRLSRPDGEPVFYKDWTRIEDTKIENEDSEFWRMDEFRCELRWEKVKLYDRDAQEYLRFAEQDLRDDSEKGRTNAIINADMAVKCRVDELMKLLNLKGISSRKRWNQPQKRQVLETFDIPNPEILKSLLTSKRNRLVHEYETAERRETQDAVELAQLFLKATEQYVERGYIASATVAYESWFKPAYGVASWFGGDPNQIVRGKYGYQYGLSHEYPLTFDFEYDTVKLSYLYKELFRECYLKNGKERARKESIMEEKKPITISFRECQLEDIVNLMAQLIVKGGR